MSLYGSGSTSQYLWRPLGPWSDGQKPMSISMWVNLTSGTDQSLAGLVDSGGSSLAGLYYSNTNAEYVSLQQDTAGTQNLPNSFGFALPSGWVHLVGMYNPSGVICILYINGANTNPDFTGLVGQNFNQFRIGNMGASTGAFTPGAVATTSRLAEVTLFNKALALSSVQDLFTGVNPLETGDADSILAYYPLRRDLRDYSNGHKVHLVPTSGYTPRFGPHSPTQPPPTWRRVFLLQPPPGTTQTLTPGTGSAWTPTGRTPAITVGNTLVPGVGTFSAVGHNPTIAGGASFVPGVGALGFTGYAPAIAAGTTGTGLVPGTDDPQFIGYAPTITNLPVAPISPLDPSKLTVGDLVRQALKDAGAIGVGQTPLAEDLNDGIFRLQMMLQQWERKRWLVYHLVDLSVVSTGVVSYSIGPGGNFDTNLTVQTDPTLIKSVRPARIESAFVRLLQSPQTPLDLPLSILKTREDYNRIALKNLNSYPSYVFMDTSWPLGQVYVWPVPSAGNFEIHLSVMEQLPLVFTNVAQTFNIPYEYYQALVSNLAIRLRPKYGITSFQGDHLPQIAKDSLQTLRQANTQIAQLSLPSALRPSGPGYNIFTDNY